MAIVSRQTLENVSTTFILVVGEYKWQMDITVLAVSRHHHWCQNVGCLENMKADNSQWLAVTKASFSDLSRVCQFVDWGRTAKTPLSLLNKLVYRERLIHSKDTMSQLRCWVETRVMSGTQSNRDLIDVLNAFSYYVVVVKLLSELLVKIDAYDQNSSAVPQIVSHLWRSRGCVTFREIYLPTVMCCRHLLWTLWLMGLLVCQTHVVYCVYTVY